MRYHVFQTDPVTKILRQITENEGLSENDALILAQNIAGDPYYWEKGLIVVAVHSPENVCKDIPAGRGPFVVPG